MKFVIDDEVVLSRPLEGPLAAHITAFAKRVSEQGYARGVPGADKFCSRRVLADGSNSMPSAYALSPPSIRLDICDLARASRADPQR
jgi:hypothetical protein